jgi:hypothetical protein
LLATTSWLKSKGVGRHTLDNWVKSGKLNSLVKGVLNRPDAKKITWQAVICSLQRMECSLMLGGITALEFQGFGHYLSFSQNKTIYLYGNDKLPAWVNKVLPETHFIKHNGQELFNTKDIKSDLYSEADFQSSFINAIAWGIDEWMLGVSTAELAFFELLLDVPEHLSFEHADELMQGLTSLSPRRLNKLLEFCTNIKVKRLFLWFAEKHKHPWFNKLELERFSMERGALGSGKRVLAKNGKLDNKYLITVPREFNEY